MKKITLYLTGLLIGLVSFSGWSQLYSDNFDSYTANTVPTGWTSYTTQTDDPGFMVVADTGLARSPYQILAHMGVNINQESTSWIVSPAFNVGSNQELIFYWREKWAHAYNYSGVYVSTASSDPINNPNDFVELAEFDPDDYPNTWNQWNKAMFDLRSYANQTIYIAFKYTGDFAHDFYVDDFQISDIPYCNPTTNIDVTNYTDTTLDVVWDAVSGVDDYEIVWGPAGFDPNTGTPELVSGATTYTITGLQPATWYDIYVRAYCSSYNYSSWAGPEAGRTSGPPPANDTCGGAIALTVYPALGGSVGHETVGDSWDATPSSMSQTSCDSYGTNLDMFYTFTAPSDGKVVILTDSTQGNRIEAAIYDSCGGNEIACFPQGNRKFATGLTPGQDYVLQIWHDDFNKGVFTIALEEAPPPPANDLCDNAEVLTIGTSCNPVIGNNEYATDSGVSSPGCANYRGGDIWYQFTVPSNQTVFVETTGISGSSVHDTGMAVYEGDCSNLSLIACDDDSGSGTFSKISVSATAGTTYYVRVWEYGNNSFGEIGVCAYGAPPPPVNDNCAGGIVVQIQSTSCTNVINADNSSGTDSGVPSPSCASYNGGDLWYKVVVPTSGHVEMETVNVGGISDSGMAFYTGSCSNLTEVACNDDSNGLMSRLVADGYTAGDTLYVRVWGYGGSRGQIGFCAYDPNYTSVQDLADKGFAFYPNPTNGRITLTANENINRVEISSITGQVLYREELNAENETLDISNLPSGVYFMNVYIGDDHGTYRIVKE